MKKRLLSVLLVIVMVAALAAPMSQNAYAEDYRAWAQGDSRWGSIRMGSTSSTIAEYGCAVTSVTKLMIQAGFKSSDSFNVGTFANWLNNHSGYDQGDLFLWGKATECAPGFSNYGTLLSWGTYSSSGYNDTIINWIKSGYHMVINVNDGGHWIAVDEAKSLSTGTVYIMDSKKNTQNADISLASRYSTFNLIHAYKGGSTPNVNPPEEAPVLKDLRTKYANGESVVLTCDAVSWANQYMFVAEKWNGSEWKTVHRQARSTSRECTINVTEGQYRVYAVAYDTSRWMADGSDYYYVSSDRVTFTVAGDHVCDNAEYVYYWKAHPHYNCYRCSICGKVNEDRSSSNFIESCRECHRPSKPAFVDLQPVYRVGETITFRWNATANTTHYNFWIWKQDDTGTWEDDHGKWKTYEHLFEIDSGKTYELPAGEYRVLLTACNKNWWEEDNSDYLHNESEFNYFSVKTACEIDGHVWDKGVVTQQPTATAEGVKTFTCSVCGETRTESIPKPEPVDPNPFVDVAAGKFYYDPVLWAISQDPKVTTGVTDTTFEPDRVCTRAHVVTFLWRANGCPNPTSLTSNFKDVKDTSKYYYKAVLWASEQGITTGYSDGTFRPDDECTRGQVVAFLWRAKGQPAPTSTTNPFSDVPAGKYFTTAVLWALENDITTGRTPTTFGPDDACTRGHVVTFLYRAYN